MFTSLFKDTIVYGLANAAQKLAPVVILPLITKFLGPEALRNYDIGFTYAYLVSWLVILGQDAAASILFFDRRSGYGREKATGHAFLLQVISLLVSSLLLAVLPQSAFLWLFPHNPQLVMVWQKALFILPGHILLNYSLNLLLWQKRRVAYLVLCLLQTALLTGSVTVALVVLGGGGDSLFNGIIGSTTAGGLIGIAMVRKEVFSSLLPPDAALFKKLLWLGLPFALTSFLHQVMPAIDRYFLLHFQLGQGMAPYVLAVKLGSLINFAFSAFVLAFTPYSLAKLQGPEAEKELSQLFRVVYLLGFALLPLVLLFRDPIVLLFADRSYGLAAELLPFFFFGWLFDLFTYFSTLGIYRSQKTVNYLVLYLLGFGAAALFNLLLIPRLGMHGAAASFFLAKALVFVTALVGLKRHFHLRVRLSLFLAAFAISGLACFLLFRFSAGWMAPLVLLLAAGAALLIGRTTGGLLLPRGTTT